MKPQKAKEESYVEDFDEDFNRKSSPLDAFGFMKSPQNIYKTPGEF